MDFSILVQLKTMKYSGIFTFLLASSTSFSQYCTSVGPTTTIDSNLQSFSLTGESATAINYTGCPGVIGLEDKTSTQSVSLNAGSNYTAYAQFGTCGGNYTGVGSAWIDFNSNQVFEPSELIGTWSGIPPTALSTWNFTVPSGAITGTTRLRVIQREGGSLPIDPCSSFSWGSVTDFTVNIGGGMDCSGYLGQTYSDPRVVSALPFSETHSNQVCYFNNFTVYGSPDVYYRLLPQQLGAEFITVSLCGSAIDTYLTITDASGTVLWYNDDSNCGTGSKIHFSTAGHDTLFVIVQGYGIATGDYNILIEQELVSLEDISVENIRIFPNPATEYIATDYSGNLSYRLTDLSGKLILSGVFNSANKIAIDQLTKGCYLLNCFNPESGQQFVMKIVKE